MAYGFGDGSALPGPSATDMLSAYSNPNTLFIVLARSDQSTNNFDTDYYGPKAGTGDYSSSGLSELKYQSSIEKNNATLLQQIWHGVTHIFN